MTEPVNRKHPILSTGKNLVALSYRTGDDAPQGMDAYREKIWKAIEAKEGGRVDMKRISTDVLGMNETYLQQFFGKKASPRHLPEEVRDRLAAYLGVLSDSLKPPQNHPKGVQSPVENLVGGDIGLIKYPVPPTGLKNLRALGTVVGGRGDDADAFQFNGQVNEYMTRPPQLEGVAGAYAVYIHGDSMEPVAYDGQVAYVHPHRPPRPNRLCVVELHDHTAYIKEFVKRTPTRLIVRQYNPQKVIEFDLETVKNVHYVPVFGDPD